MIRFFSGVLFSFGAAGGFEIGTLSFGGALLTAIIGAFLFTWPMLDGTIQGDL